MITGTYKFYLDGEYIGEQKNSITRAGRVIILKAIMGILPTVGGEIHIGLDSTANGTPDADGLIPNNILGFDIASSPVKMSFLDNSGGFDAMVFKASFGSSSSQGEKYKIYELGLFPGSGNQNAQALNETTLFSGSTADNWKEGETLLLNDTGSTTPATSCYITSALASYSFRVGDTALFIKSGDTVRINDTAKIDAYNLALFNTIDTLKIAYAKLTGNAPTLTIKFKTTDSDYYLASISITGAQTYGIVEKTISQMETAKVGSPRWSDINEISILSNADIVIDAVRFNNIDSVDTVYGMVSRAVLTTPITKESNSVLDIEYYLSMAFNKTVT